MASLQRRFVVLALLLAVVGCGSSSSSSPHSLRYFYTALSEPGQGLPQFIVVAYVDDQLFVKYDSDSKKMHPQVPWMEKVEEYKADYWEWQSQVLQGTEPSFRVSLENLRDRYNQKNSTGLHILQWMYGCEVGPDAGLRKGHNQFAYDGEDFLAFDKETLTWTARAPHAQPTKSRWDANRALVERQKYYLEEICVEWLQRYLDYGKETLQRTERPMARVARKEGYDGRETLTCQLYGFYPREIEVTWVKDGEVWDQDTLHGGVTPNSDGTYHTWRSIEVDPKEKDHYRCRVGHDSLLEPLELAWEEPASNVGLIVGVLAAVLAAIVLGAGVALYMKKRNQPKGGYKAPPVPVPEA